MMGVRVALLGRSLPDMGRVPAEVGRGGLPADAGRDGLGLQVASMRKEKKNSTPVGVFGKASDRPWRPFSKYEAFACSETSGDQKLQTSHQDTSSAELHIPLAWEGIMHDPHQHVS